MNAILHKQQGSAILFILGGLATLAAMAVMGSTLFTTLISGNQRANLSISTGQILTQAAYTIVTEVNTSGSYPIATAFLVASPAPTGGGQIYAASAAPKVDAWGTAIGYCVFTAAAQGDPVFAVVSAGPNKTFQTTCAQALIGTISGDDGVRAKNVANIRQGVGGTVYFGDPVTNVSDLALLAAPRAGEVRLVKSVKLTYINPTGVAGASNWYLDQSVPIITSGADCSSLPLGTIGKDSTGNVYSCM